MIRNSVIVVAIASLISASIGAHTYDINLAENNQQQFLPLLAPLAIGGLALLLSKGEEPAAASKKILTTMQSDLEKAAPAGNSLSQDINLEDNIAQYAITVGQSMEHVKAILDQARPRLEELMKGKKMTAEQAADQVSKELEPAMAEETVKEATKSEIQK